MNLFQKDDKYLAFTVVRRQAAIELQLALAEPDNRPRVLQRAPLEQYDGEITLRVLSRDGNYSFSYSLDEGETFDKFATIGAQHILAHGSYTGAYFGLYATSNGEPTSAYADFDWARYKVFER